MCAKAYKNINIKNCILNGLLIIWCVICFGGMFSEKKRTSNAWFSALEKACKSFRKYPILRTKSKNKYAHMHDNRYIPTCIKDIVHFRDQGRCVYCHSNANLQFYHIIPYSKGGSSKTINNIQLLCQPCNMEKGAKIY